jgi:tetratricopeptide (TPR) repeat protein
MKKRRGIVVTATVLSVVIISIVFISSMIINRNYRSQIPAPPDMNMLSPSLQNQITGALKKAERRPTSLNIGYLGMVYHSSSYYDQAAQCYRLAARKNHSKWMWNYYLGYLEKEIGENMSSVENFSEVIKTDPGNDLALYYIGEGYQAIGSNDKAESVYRKIAATDTAIAPSVNSSRKDNYPLRTYAMFQLASIYMNTSRLDTAEGTLWKIIREQPDFGQAYRLLGNIYSMKGDDSLGRKYVSRASDLRIYTPPADTLLDILARISCSDIYLLKQVDDADKGGYPNFALELISTGLLNMPGNKFIISKAIKLYLARGLDKLALPYLDKHLQDFSDDVNELRMVADLCTKRGLYKQALEYYNKASVLLPDDLDLQLARILSLGNAGMKKEAVREMEALEAKNANDVRVLTNAMYIMIMIGEKETGMAYLSRLRKLYPEDPRVLRLSGMALEQEGEEAKALELYEASFKGNPEDWSTARLLGDLFIKRKMWRKAVSHYSEAIEYFPNDPYIQERLGTLLVMCPDERFRNISLGREYSERAFYNKSSPPLTVISAGRCISQSYAAEGDKQNAFKYLNTTISMARKEKVPQDIIGNLEQDLQAYR